MNFLSMHVFHCLLFQKTELYKLYSQIFVRTCSTGGTKAQNETVLLYVASKHQYTSVTKNLEFSI